MKKILTILGAATLIAIPGTAVVACGKTKDENNASTKPEIKLQTDSSTIKVEKTLDIKIENYLQINKTLKEFTLDINGKSTEEEILNQVGEFDQKNGKFTVQGKSQGTANITVQAYYQDKNLGQDPITATISINVIPTTDDLLAIQVDKTELESSEEDKAKAEIKIENYEEVKIKWKDFSLNISTLEACYQDEVLHQTGFNEEDGVFTVSCGMNPGKAKVSISATSKGLKENQNLKNELKTFTTNEIVITVKKIKLKYMIEEVTGKGKALGYGLTGAEFLEAVQSTMFDSKNIEYGRDYEILNLNQEKELEKNTELKFIAGENSKFFEGDGTLKLTNLDLGYFKEELDSVPIGTSGQEIQDKVQAVITKIMPKVKINKDYFIEGHAIVVGKTIQVNRLSESEWLAGEVEILVTGESYAEWSLNQLNNQTSKFVTNMNDLIEENNKTEYPEPIKNPDLKDQWAKNYFEMHCFFARVFLETKYAVVGLSEGKPKIKEVNETVEYEKVKKELITKINDSGQIGDKQEYNWIFQEYENELRKTTL